MSQHRIAVAALAAVFGLAATGSTLVAGSLRTAAYADEGENHQGEHHDNGRHNGWYKHNHHGENGDNEDHHGGRYGSALRGTIVGIDGAMLSVRLNDGRVVTVNDQNALNAGGVPNLYVGETIALRGGFGNDGVFYANRVYAYNGNNGYNNGGYGYNNGGNCNVNAAGLVTVAGYERGGFNGSAFTLRQPLVSGIPIGTDYTIVVNGSTCVQRALGSNGEHVTVVGIPMNDGHTIQAVRITG